MRGLCALDAWAATWQRGPWSLATLARDLTADLIVVPEVPGGTSILGASLRSDWSIGINERIVDTTMEVPVVLHEAGHLLTRPLTVAVAGCELGWRTVGGEVLAWCGAGRLSLSAQQGNQVDRGEATLGELAELNGVPVELIGIGQAILHQLDRPVGLVERHDLQRNRAELSLALHAWHRQMVVLVGALVLAA